VNREILKRLTIHNTSPTILARDLFRMLFDPDELIMHSLLGRGDPHNMSKEPLPPLNPVKRDAVFEYVCVIWGFETEMCGRTSSNINSYREFKALKSALTRSLANFMFDLRRGRHKVMIDNWRVFNKKF